MRGIIVLSFDGPEASLPDIMTSALRKIDPPNLPGFNGEARLSVGQPAERVEEWLSE